MKTRAETGPVLGPHQRPDLARRFAVLLAAALVAALLPAQSTSPAQSTESSTQTPDRTAFEAGQIQFPGDTWQVVENPTDWGWSSPQLETAKTFFESLESATVMVIHRGVLIASWGDIAARYNSQSMRKALLGAMIGQEIAANRLSLDSTLEELGIDDTSQPLTNIEKTATLKDMLQSTTGIYLSALYETGGWKRNKPERGAHTPGEFWYYNNWGFNALLTVFEQTTRSKLHEAFLERVASPIGMEDYRPGDVQYLTRESPSEKFMKNDSQHNAYIFMISTRDMGRFGLLYLAKGKWRDQQVVPRSWTELPLNDNVETLEFLGGDHYGYLWWVSPEESRLGQAIGARSFKATGGRGHKTVVVPELDLVVVHRLATGDVSVASQMDRRLNGAPSVDDQDFASLMKKIVEAHPDR